MVLVHFPFRLAGPIPGRSSRAVFLRVLAALMLALVVVVSCPGAAQAGSCPSPGVQSGQVRTFTVTNAGVPESTVSVPAGSVTITAAGGPGGEGQENSGTRDGSPGGGGMAQAAFEFTSPQTLTILVGEEGGASSAGGLGGGGFGDSAFFGGELQQGGEGGGGSYVFDQSGQPLVVAGGGGGTGSLDTGIDQLGGAGGGIGSGGAGQAGSSSAVSCGGAGGAGGGGSATASGTAGAAASCTSGTVPSGQAGKGPVTGPTDPDITGGDGGLDTIGGYGGDGGIPGDFPDFGMGGGGGGGYTGGGGGGDSENGGGGSGGGGAGFVAAGAVSKSGQSGAWSSNVGRVTVSYPLGPSVSISDPDPVPRPDEGKSGQIDFPVALSASSTKAVTVVAATADGTGPDVAVAGVDYKQTKQTLTFPAGSTATRTLDVPLIGTIPVANNETFSVSLSDPQNASLGTATATGTILCSAKSAPGLSPPPAFRRKRRPRARAS